MGGGGRSVSSDPVVCVSLINGRRGARGAPDPVNRFRTVVCKFNVGRRPGRRKRNQ
jgi:hypothetical protein